MDWNSFQFLIVIVINVEFLLNLVTSFFQNKQTKNLKMISKIEQEIDEEREEKLQQNSSNVLTWILKEIQEKQEDYITIVCKVRFLFVLF